MVKLTKLSRFTTWRVFVLSVTPNLWRSALDQDFQTFHGLRERRKGLDFLLKLLGAASIIRLLKDGFDGAADCFGGRRGSFYHNAQPHFGAAVSGDELIASTLRNDYHRQAVP